MKSTLIIPDCHVPYHSKKAFEITLQIAKDCKSLTEVILLGDFADFYAVNSHGKDPRLSHLLIQEVQAVNKALDLIDKELPSLKKVYLEGNHEYRLERYIVNNAPSLFSITQWDFLFELNQRPNWSVVPYGPNQHVKVNSSALFARHEPYAMSSAKASLSHSGANLVYGHVHRKEEAWLTRPDGSKLVNFCPGWLGDVRNTKVFGYTKRPPVWHLGAALIHVEGKAFHIDPITFTDKITCAFNGKSYR